MMSSLEGFHFGGQASIAIFRNRMVEFNSGDFSLPNRCMPVSNDNPHEYLAQLSYTSVVEKT